MANVEYDDEGWYDGPSEAVEADGRGLRSRKIVNGAGALTSLALVLGLGVWGYKLAVRDVNGVPVIRSLVGPARVAPTDPGGELADHQGLAVNAIAAEGTAAAPAERLVLAPRPMELAPEDQPMADVQVASVAGAAQAQAPVVAAAAAPVPQVDPVSAPATGGPMVQDLIDADPAAAAGATDPAAAAVAEALAVIPADVPGVSRSLRPQGRPAMLAMAPEGATDPIAEAAAAAVAAALSSGLGVENAEVPADAVTEAVSETAAPLPTAVQPTSARTPAQTEPAAQDAGPVELASAALPAGTRLAQLGAFQTAEEARAEWDKVIADLGPLMQGKKRVIETAQSGGRTFYRLRVQGFADLADARRFCAALKAEGRLCTPAQAQG